MSHFKRTEWVESEDVNVDNKIRDMMERGRGDDRETLNPVEMLSNGSYK